MIKVNILFLRSIERAIYVLIMYLITVYETIKKKPNRADIGNIIYK